MSENLYKEWVKRTYCHYLINGKIRKDDWMTKEHANETNKFNLETQSINAYFYVGDVYFRCAVAHSIVSTPRTFRCYLATDCACITCHFNVLSHKTKIPNDYSICINNDILYLFILFKCSFSALHALFVFVYRNYF